MSKTTCSRGGDRVLTLRAGSVAFLDHLRLLGRSEATIRIHANAQHVFGKFWGADRDLREATLADLEAYATDVRARVSRESAYLYLVSVRSLFRFLVESRQLLVDPSLGLPMPKMHDRLTGRILTHSEMERLVESPDSSTIVGLRDRAMLEFLYSTGLRASESRHATIEDLREDSILVRAGKGGKDRLVPVGARAMAWVRAYLRQARPAMTSKKLGVEDLWISRWARPFSEQMFLQHLRKLGCAAGIGHLTCHTIRRSMATHLLSAGASPQEVSGILGHEDLKSLSRYVRVVARELKETHEATHPREQ